MPYRHFGNIGDVWKHLALCALLPLQKPAWYIETNSAYAEYVLSPEPAKEYGIYTFLWRSREMALFEDAQYRMLEEKAVASGRYLGSPALALNILQESPSPKFTFFDREAQALQSIKDYAGAKVPLAEVELIPGDSIDGIFEMLDSGLPESSFLHIDPYLIFEKNEDGRCYYDAFLKAVRKAVPVFLWYGFENPQKQDLLRRKMKASTQDLPVQFFELWLAHPIDWKEVKAHPGVMGCGLATAHLKPGAAKLLKSLARDLCSLYRGAFFLQSFPGDLEWQYSSS